MRHRQLVGNETLLGYIFFMIISFMYGLVNTEFEITGFASTAIIIVEIGIFLFWMLSHKYNIRMLIGIIVLLLVACVTYITTGETVFMVMLMVAIMFSGLSYEIMLRYIFYERLIIFFAIIVFSFIGIIPINAVESIKGGTFTTVTGYGLGYNHPNQLAYAIGFLMFLYICYRNSKINRYNIYILLGITLLGYFITKSRTFFVIMICTLLILWMYQSYFFKNVISNILRVGAVWIMPICTLFALGLPILMSTTQGQIKTILYTINGIMGSRFTHSARVFENYSLTLFGGVVKFDILQSLYSYSVVDSGYIGLLYNFGIVGFGIFMVLYFFTIKKLVKQKQYIFIIVITGISLWGVSENILRSFVINFTVIFWSEILNEHVVSAETSKSKKKRVRLKL